MFTFYSFSFIYNRIRISFHSSFIWALPLSLPAPVHLPHLPPPRNESVGGEGCSRQSVTVAPLPPCWSCTTLPPGCHLPTHPLISPPSVHFLPRPSQKTITQDKGLCTQCDVCRLVWWKPEWISYDPSLFVVCERVPLWMTRNKSGPSVAETNRERQW